MDPINYTIQLQAPTLRSRLRFQACPITLGLELVSICAQVASAHCRSTDGIDAVVFHPKSAHASDKYKEVMTKG